MIDPDNNTTTTTTRVIGVFDSLNAAAERMAMARSAGVADDRIHALFADSPEARDFLAGDASQTGPAALAGGAIGGAAMAVAATVLALPGVNALAIGPLFAALGGAGVGAASGGALGALVGLGIPRNEAVLRLAAVQQGAVLVGIDVTDEDVDQVIELLRAGDSIDVVHTTVAEDLRTV